MFNASSSDKTNKQVIISLRQYSHEVCVAATHTEYWQQLTKGSTISITNNGIYVPKELQAMHNEEDEPNLQLIIQSHHEEDNQQVEIISNRMRHDFESFATYDQSVYDVNNGQLLVFASLFNSLPMHVFDFERTLLGEQNNHIKTIEKTFQCSIIVDQLTSRRYRFTIRHKELMIMDLVAIQIQALVKQVQYEYIIAFAQTMGRSLLGSTEPRESAVSSLCDRQSLSSFQFISQRNDEEDNQQLTASHNDQPVIRSARNDNDDAIRYKPGDV